MNVPLLFLEGIDLVPRVSNAGDFFWGWKFSLLSSIDVVGWVEMTALCVCYGDIVQYRIIRSKNIQH